MEDPTLEIEVVGHCLFAMEDEGFTVLMPAPMHMPCIPGDHHYAMLKYLVVGADGQAVWKCESLVNRELDLSLQGGEPFTPPDLSGIANIWQVTNQKLQRNLIDDANPSNVRARVKVAHGSGAPVLKSPDWDLEGYESRVHMSNEMKWTIGRVNSTSLTLTGLHGEPDAGPFVIEPINGVVRLRIEHAPYIETDPTRGDFAKHFEHFYNLFPEYTGERVLPRYNPEGEPGHLVTCMSAWAPVEP